MLKYEQALLVVGLGSILLSAIMISLLAYMLSLPLRIAVVIVPMLVFAVSVLLFFVITGLHKPLYNK